MLGYCNEACHSQDFQCFRTEDLYVKQGYSPRSPREFRDTSVSMWCGTGFSRVWFLTTVFASDVHPPQARILLAVFHSLQKAVPCTEFTLHGGGSLESTRKFQQSFSPFQCPIGHRHMFPLNLDILYLAPVSRKRRGPAMRDSMRVSNNSRATSAQHHKSCIFFLNPRNFMVGWGVEPTRLSM